jgi:hypothetical protein
MATQNYRTLNGINEKYGLTFKLYENVEMFYLILFLNVKPDILIY